MPQKEGKANVSSSEANAEDVMITPTLSYEEKLQFVSEIAKPMATRKLNKKIIKLIRKVSSVDKKHVVLGLKNVQKELRKNNKGIVILAGDIFPIDIICHIPAVCEEKNVPYCYIPSRRDFAEALDHIRQAVVVMIKSDCANNELYETVVEGIGNLPTPY